MNNGMKYANGTDVPYPPDCADCPQPAECKANNDCAVLRQIRHGHERKAETSESVKPVTTKFVFETHCADGQKCGATTTGCLVGQCLRRNWLTTTSAQFDLRIYAHVDYVVCPNCEAEIRGFVMDPRGALDVECNDCGKKIDVPDDARVILC